jgi:tRNA G10  N-methylase Trm11
MAIGETSESADLLAGVKKPHLIVTDLPYGIQHQGQLIDLLTDGLPVWAQMLSPGGAMAMAWESTRFPRDEMIALVEVESGLTVLNDPPYDALAHRVDRVIKQRDVIVARRDD